MCELDFAYQFLPHDYQIVSVTGTDGKSTTAWIMYNILEKEYNVKNSVKKFSENGFLPSQE
jgi:UDP-N-acetylmuramoylalanine-D-glutamate ligase